MIRRFDPQPPLPTMRFRGCAGDGSIAVNIYDHSYGQRVGAMITVQLGDCRSIAQAHGVGESDDDAITDAECRLREDHPRAWELYASAVFVGAVEADDDDDDDATVPPISISEVIP